MDIKPHKRRRAKRKTWLNNNNNNNNCTHHSNSQPLLPIIHTSRWRRRPISWRRPRRPPTCITCTTPTRHRRRRRRNQLAIISNCTSFSIESASTFTSFFEFGAHSNEKSIKWKKSARREEEEIKKRKEINSDAIVIIETHTHTQLERKVCGNSGHF